MILYFISLHRVLKFNRLHGMGKHFAESRHFGAGLVLLKWETSVEFLKFKKYAYVCIREKDVLLLIYHNMNDSFVKALNNVAQKRK